VVSKWTGIPVSKLLEAEMQKLVHMEERLRERSSDRGGVRAVSNAVRRARTAADRTGHRHFLSRPTGVARRSWRGRCRVPLR